MSDRSAYTPEEWLTLRLAPALVGASVMAASPDGVLAALKESVAMGTASVRALGRHGDLPLLKALATDREGVADALKAALGGGDLGARAAQVRATALDHATRAVATLRAKGDAREASAYGEWLVAVAQGVAGASSESGGFLGFGGEKVSAAERDVITALEAALESGAADATAPPATPPAS